MKESFKKSILTLRMRMKLKYPILSTVYRKLVYILKLIIFIPKVLYVKTKIMSTSKDMLYILPHEGLGDFVTILPALTQLSPKFKIVKIFIRRNTWEAFSTCFEIPSNVKPVFFYHNKTYVFSKVREKIISRRCLFIKLGYYGWDPTLSYPNSFFYKLGIFDHKTIAQNVTLNKLNIEKLDIDFINGSYEYLNLGTSNNTIFHHKINYRPCIESISHDEIILHHDNLSKSVQISQYPLLTNIMLAIRSSRAIVSDAGIFNILIRLKERPRLKVYTRDSESTHSFNKEIYKVPIDGKVYDFPI